MTALVADAELPPKIGLHPTTAPSRSRTRCRRCSAARTPSGADDLVGMKWVAGFDTNKALGIPAINALVILNDATTGLPIAVMDGGPITAMRTAAVSGVAIRHFAPAVSGRPVSSGPDRGRRAGPQSPAGPRGRAAGRRRPRLRPVGGRTSRPSSSSGGRRTASGSIEAAESAREAIDGADVVVTAAAFGPKRQVMTNDWLGPDTTVVPVDYATYCSAEVARDAALFLIDHRGQLDAGRANGLFDDFPEPVATIGEAILAGPPRPAHGRVVAMHLGVGLADVVFGSAILARAAELGLGIVLPR